MMHRNFASLFLFCATAFVIPLNASAAPITAPTGLNPGDIYRLVFVTSTTGIATSSNIADYNAFVTSVAAGIPELASLGTTWSVIGSTASVAARDNTGTNPNVATGSPIYRLDDVRIANNNTDLWDGGIAQSLMVNESGGQVSQDYAFTGSLLDGQPHARYPLGSISGASNLGRTDLLVGWVDASFDSPSALHRFYAISGELTVVPEPSTLLLVGIGATVFAGWGLRSRSRRKR